MGDRELELPAVAAIMLWTVEPSDRALAGWGVANGATNATVEKVRFVITGVRGWDTADVIGHKS